ncbi:MAG: tetratricopeptide repeat protein [Desulfobulbaceae bacterium]|jgi:tetratricopeptide (TPR) repeat protein|nr:tetratricopeptide repeat protein [Desulfobulbaceae bacterium]
MTPPPPHLSQDGEAAWLRVKRHLEWCDGFALCFIFTAHAAVIRLFRERLADIYRARLTRLEIALPQQPDGLFGKILPELLRPPVHKAALQAPYWLDLSSELGEDWREARITFLLRLNERREALRRSLGCPLVLILPAAEFVATKRLAPDLWSIRHFSLTTENWLAPTRPQVATAPPPERPAAPAEISSDYDLSLIGEWERLRGKDAMDRGIFLAGQRAYQVYDQLRRHQQAGEIAARLLDFCRQQIERLGETPQSLRDLSISLNQVGETAQALGQLEAARQAYEESLGLDRKIIERLGETPQSLRDLSISLNKVGETAQALGQLEAARQAYQESLGLRRKIIERLGETPQSLRDLSVVLKKIHELD